MAGRRCKLCRGKPANDHPADHIAMDLLQGPVVDALIGKQERVPCTMGLDHVARESTALTIRAQFAQLHFIGRTATAFNGNVIASRAGAVLCFGPDYLSPVKLRPRSMT